MAYCTNCGAYIPDGETICISCGQDSSKGMSESASTSASHAQAASYAAVLEKATAQQEDLQETLEKTRREQQEKSREWANQAYAEYKENQTHTTSGRTGGQPSAAKKPETGVSSGKLMAGLSYVSFLCFLQFIFSSKSGDFAKFHGKQGIVLFIATIIIDILGRISGLAGFALSLLRLYLIYKGIKNVVEGKKEELPWIGQFAEKF